MDANPVPKHKYLVFTSAGGSNNVDRWLGERHYDLWICYYGCQSNTLASCCDFYLERKGGKFQNFFFLYQQYQDVLAHYDAILLADDDILISPSEINRLFAIRAEKSLKCLQPAFLPHGKNSHPITEYQWFSGLRYTNFIEVTFALFERNALFEFLELYDPVVNCWGVDWWFCGVFQSHYGPRSIAIADQVVATNPHDAWKPRGGEIEHLYSRKKLADTWLDFKTKHQIQTEEGQFKVFKKEYSFAIKPLMMNLVSWAKLFFNKVFRVLSVKFRFE